jgi:DNA invertase Pin-like site-specific DNA recombinase
MHAPDIYREQIQRYCAYRELNLREVYSDIDFSGYRNSEKRPALIQLIEERHIYSGVVVPKLSRFGRSLRHLCELFELFDKDGIDLIFLDIGVDTGTSQGRLLRNVMGAFAEYESAMKSDYSRASFRHIVMKGLPWGGTTPYGYLRRGRAFEIDPERARIVQEIFARFAGGGKYHRIADWLNDQGIPSPGGRLWRRVTLKNILSNSSYAGFRMLDGERVAVQWEPIVSMELWERTVERVAALSNHAPATPTSTKLLSGLLYCDVCGANLGFKRGSPTHTADTYMCRGKGDQSYCPGGGIAQGRADEIVTRAYLARFGTSSIWQMSGTEHQNEMLKRAISRIDLPAREKGNRRGKGRRRGRDVKIVWASGDAPPAPLNAAITSLPWNEYQRHLRQREGFSG